MQHLNIVHFNDVYDFKERQKEPVGGVTRFGTNTSITNYNTNNNNNHYTIMTTHNNNHFTINHDNNISLHYSNTITN